MTGKPLVTFVLLAYNQQDTIREAVEGAFAQTYSPLEIILSDDCSKDGTFDIMEAMTSSYTGPHRIVLNRNPENLGIVGHVNRVFDMARGELIVTAAGDDVSLPHRTELAVEAWVDGGCRADGLVFAWVDRETGASWVPPPQEEISLDTMIERGTARIRGASAVWTRRLWERWGPLPPTGLAEDRLLSFRALLGGGILSDPRPVVRYRVPAAPGLMPGHERLADSLWRMKRNLRFYRCYRADLVKALDEGWCAGNAMGALIRRLDRKTEALDREIRWLERGTRRDGLRYALALLTGQSGTRASFRNRALRALTVARRLVLEGRRITVFDENQHHGSRAEG